MSGAQEKTPARQRGASEFACARCDADTEPDLLRAYEDGAPMHCSRCGLDLDEPSAEWLRAHGYTPEGQERQS